jgi:hypothetical protein
VVTAAFSQPHFPHAILTVAWALQLTHVSLMAIWLALGKTSGPLRLMGVVVVVAPWSWALAVLPDSPEPEQWAVLLMAQTIAVSVPLLGARWLGLELVDASSASEVDGSATEPQRWRFSIAYLLGWMTALAVMLGTLQYIAPFDSLPFGLVVRSSLLVFLVGRAALAWAGLWTVLGTDRPTMRIITLCAAGFAAVTTLWLAQPRFAGGFSYLLALVFLEAAFLLGLLAVFRTVGYRLRVRRGE